MNSSSTYLSSHQAAENPSATCRLTGDDSIAHKESALYRKARNLSSIHDGMPNLCRIPDGCGLVYIKMLRLSSFFCQKFVPRQKPFENIGILDPLLRGQQLLPKRRTGYPPKKTPLPCPCGLTDTNGEKSGKNCMLRSFPQAHAEKNLGERGPDSHESPFSQTGASMSAT